MIGVAQICRKVWLTAHKWWSMMYRLLQSISSCQRLNSLPPSILNCRLVPLSTSGPLCKGLPPKPRLPGFGYNRSQMVYKQHKQFKFVFDGETLQLLIIMSNVLQGRIELRIFGKIIKGITRDLCHHKYCY